MRKARKFRRVQSHCRIINPASMTFGEVSRDADHTTRRNRRAKGRRDMKSFFGAFCSGWMQALRDYSCILEELNRQLGEQRGSPVVTDHGGIISKQGFFRRGELAEPFGDNVHELTQFRLCRTFGNRKIRNIPDPEIRFQAARPAKRMDPASCPEEFVKRALSMKK